MEIPKTVRVCGLDYEVVIDDNLFFERGAVGTHNAERLMITLHTRGVNNQRLMQTFLHEIIHAVDEHFMGQVLEEKQVNALAAGLYQVLADNDLCCLIKKDGSEE